jgi:phosphoribosylaminoimidazole-succinocarboxamide synthase
MVGFDKQFLREWLKSGGGGFGQKTAKGEEEEGVTIPQEIVEQTWGKYMEAFEMLTGRKFVV